MLNNGHTVELIPSKPANNYLLFNNEKFILQQIHFHDPSEHQLNGKSLDMEIHLVHKNSKGKLVVLAVLLKKGKENTSLKEAFDLLPSAQKDKELKLTGTLKASDLLPTSFSYIKYEGSLTTPPTKEIVSWMVLENVGTISSKQIKVFQDLIGKNARPVQAINNRTLTKHNF